MKIALGTAQLGMNYGIANKQGIPSDDMAQKLLISAKDEGISLIDTSPLYGNAESRLGQLFSQTGFRPQIVTKLAKVKSEEITTKSIKDVIEQFHKSLKALKQKRVYGLIIHSPSDIHKKGFIELWNQVNKLKNNFYVEKVGFSLYEPDDLFHSLQHFDFDLVQVPFSIFDQRFERSGAFEMLQSKGIEVHTRSAFLQGLLLMEEYERPSWTRAFHNYFHNFDETLKKYNIERKTALIKPLIENGFISKIICGAESAHQVEEIAQLSHNSIPKNAIKDLNRLFVDDEKLIIPSQWKNHE